MFGEIQNFDAVSGGGTQGITQTSEQQMGKEDFLKLLVAQMKEQDPLNPTSNEDMVMQLAQFSAIEQTQNMNAMLEKFINSNTLGMAGDMIGQEIEAVNTDTGEVTKGIVSQVNIDGSGTNLIVGSTEVKLEHIISIKGKEATHSGSSTQ